jgi:DNA-binding response OmpR family regulator
VPYKIIVADASPSVQRTVQLAFPEPEFRLFPVEDGAALLDAAGEVRPDAVLLSLSLPGRDPGELGRLLRGRQDLRRVPLIFLRGTFESPDVPSALPDNDGVFQKPFDSERLAAAVRELIEARAVPLTLPEEPVLPPGRPAGNGRGAKGAV